MRLLLVFSVLIGAAACAQSDSWSNQSREPAFYPAPADIEVLRLDNGLQVVLMPNPAQPMVGIYCAVKVGSAWEDYATSGMSHMLEHLLFNGTEKYSQEELYAAADRAGAYNNAHTTDFYTNFMLVVPSEGLAVGLELQSQMLFHSLLPADKFAKERGIVLGEIAQSLDRETFAADALHELVYGGSSLALPTLGTAATIAAMQRDDVDAFYRRWYVPNNMVLTLAGGFTRDAALELVRQHYGTPPPRSLPPIALRGLPALESTTTVVRVGGTQRKLALVFAAPEYGDPDHAAFQMAVELLTAPGSGIVSRALDDLPPAERPELRWWWQAAPGFGRLVLDFALPAGQAPDGLYRLVQHSMIGALELGIGADDLAEAEAMARTRALKEREQLRMTGIYLAEPLVLGGPEAIVSYLPRLAAVTADDIARMLRVWLVDRPCQALLVEPAPEAAAPRAEAEPADRLERTVLASGLSLVSQQNPGSELSAIHLTVRGRALVDQRYGRPGALNLVHRMLLSGISGCDEPCLARRLRRLGAEVKLVDDPRIPMDDYYTNGRFSFVRVECPSANLRDVLALLFQLTRFSTFGAADLQREREIQRGLLQRRENTAGWQATRLLAEGLYRDHPLALPVEGTAETLAAVTYDELRSLYRLAFTPENLILAIVSPYSQDELQPMLSELPAGGGQTAAGLPPLPVTTAPARLTAHVGGPMAAVRLGSIRAVRPQDAAALELLVAVLADRLAMDLRETKGLSYSAGASVQVHGDRAVFSAWLNPPAARLAEGEQALQLFLRSFDAGTVTQQELDAARGARQGRLLMRRLDSIGRAYQLAMAELDGDLAGYLRAVTDPDTVTLADLRRAAAFFSELPLITVVVE
ncbi:MAG: pitrilysin family protein [Candidatus Krumholzibacteria bacterium]|jgi:zinc protease|nr:pitrilysin family protein [Candidatus Krumholzibacteria bacterium]